MWGVLEALRSLESPNPSEEALDLWSRPALQLYILLVAQNLTPDGTAALSGGLRDKPGKKADAYHTCYNLAGLSAAQHVVRPCAETRNFCYTGWKSTSTIESKGEGNPAGGTAAAGTARAEQEELRRRVFSSTLGYNLAPGREKIVVGDSTNELLPTHPVLNVGFLQVRNMMVWSYAQE
jgi:protein farnesyltransferase subunit beta